MATRRPPVAWVALDGGVCAAPLSGGRKAAAGIVHGAAHLLLLVADVRKLPGVRAEQEQGGGDEEQGANAALSRSTTCSEENDPRGGLRWLGWRWTAASALRLSLEAAKPPLVSFTGRPTSCCSLPTSASCQAFVRSRNKEEGTRSKVPTRHCRDRQHVLKKTTVGR